MGYFQIEFQAVHGNTSQGFVALDVVIFEEAGECPFAQAEAWPPSTTSTMSTPIPTEPPDGKT